MTERLEEFRGIVKPGRDTRLFNEWERLDHACAVSDEISYIVSKTGASRLPVGYEVVFHIRSIISVEPADGRGLEKPVFGDCHRLQINLPNNYPAASGGYPEFRFVTNVWHPNVRYYGDFKGRVCLNYSDRGTSAYLTDHLATIAAFLRYDEYHARDVHPYPEDRTVAKWTLEQAEPQGWTKFNKN